MEPEMNSKSIISLWRRKMVFFMDYRKIIQLKTGVFLLYPILQVIKMEFRQLKGSVRVIFQARIQAGFSKKPR